MSQKNLFELVYILLDKKSVTAKNLAEHFGVSERTILRWAESLAEAGVPVYSTQGRYGGFSIAENYVLDKTIFTDEEKCSEFVKRHQIAEGVYQIGSNRFDYSHAIKYVLQNYKLEIVDFSVLLRLILMCKVDLVFILIRKDEE